MNGSSHSKRKAMIKSMRNRWVPILAFALLALHVFGCTNTIIPPKHVEYGRTVYVLDFGRHSSLLLPDSDDRSAEMAFTEYAYGEWKWYAEQRTGFTRILPTLFWPTQGTLGRNISPLKEPLIGHDEQIVNSLSFMARAERRAIMRDFNPDELHYVRVENDCIKALRTELDERYERSGAEPKFVPEYRLAFVPDDAKYSAFHNCNHEVLAWLRALGCETRGTGIFADFKVKGVPSLTREEYENQVALWTDGPHAFPIPSSESETESEKRN